VIYYLKQGYQQQKKQRDIQPTGGILATAETTAIYHQKQGYQQLQKQRRYTTKSRDTSNSRNNGDIRPTGGIPATAETTAIYDITNNSRNKQTTGIYDLQQGYQ
jgi:hypothetical protein